MKKKRIEIDDEPKGLTHNPFASLLPDSKVRRTEAVSEPTKAATGVSKESLQESKIVVRREKKGRGGKTVTRVTGIDKSGAQLEELKRELSRALGCGGSIEATDIILQGELTDRAASWLGKRLSVKITIGN